MALLGPDSSQIAREVVGGGAGLAPGAVYTKKEGLSHCFVIPVGSCLGKGIGALIMVLQWHWPSRCSELCGERDSVFYNQP